MIKTIIVVEFGLSNTPNQLRTKERIWLTAFDDKVRIINPSAHTITIEHGRWFPGCCLKPHPPAAPERNNASI